MSESGSMDPPRRFERILLIIPDISGYYALPDNPHLGVGYLLAGRKFPELRRG